MPALETRLLPVHAYILLTLLLVPLWYRQPDTPPLFAPLYVSRFAVLLPMLCAIGWWLAMGLPGFAALRHDRARRGWALALLLLALWAFASTGWAFRRVENPEVGASAALQLGVTALFALVVACACPPRRQVIAVLLAGLAWNSALAVLQVGLQASVGLRVLGEFPLSIDAPGVSMVQADGVRWLRPYGLLPHPNILAGFLMVGLLAALAGLVSRRLGVWWLCTLLLLAGLWALLLTFSRAAWGGLLGGGLLALPLLWYARLRQRDSWLPLAASAGLALVVALVFAQVYRPFLLARAGVGTESIELRSVSDRVVFTDFALRAVREHPAQGVGVGNFPWRSSYYLMSTDFDLRGDNVHNVYLSAWAELGTVGLALVLIALGSGAWAAWRGLRAAPDPAGIALFAGFVALSLTGLLDHYPWTLLQFQALWWGLLAAAGHRSLAPAPQD